jgi:peroxiredoxin
MANLTGEYDVVVEAGVGLINGILGAVHENQDQNFPVMPHSLDFFLDDAPRGAGDPVPASERTGIRSRVEVQVSTPIVSLPVDTLQVRPDIPAGGVATIPRASTSSASTHGQPAPELDPAGGQEDKSSIVGIIVPPTFRSFPRVTAQVRVRVWVRDPTDGRLPEFIHGDLFVTSFLVRSEVTGVGTFLTLERTNGPLVAFQPAPGTEVTDEQRQAIASIVRNVIRSDTDPATFRVSLPPEIRHFDFKLQPEARRPSVQLLFTLTDQVPSPGAADSVGAGLLPDGADFAVGVGRDFVLERIGSKLVGALQESYSFSETGLSVTVEPDPPTFDLEPGRIVFSVTGVGVIALSGGPEDHFTFSVRQGFTLVLAGGGIEPAADGDPVVETEGIAFGEDFLEGQVRDTIRHERDAALAVGASQFREAVDVGGQLEAILSGINPASPGVSLDGVEIRAEGILVTGTVALHPSGPVAISQVARAGFNDALESWIPGGTIDRLVWEPFGIVPPEAERVDEHRFVTPEITGISILSGFCLRVEGTRVTAGGGVVPVSGSACFRFSPVLGPVQGVSTGTERPLFPLTDAVDGGIRVVGHFDPWAPGRVPAKGHASLLLYFGTDGGEEAARLLQAALGASGKREGAVLALAVVGPGRLPAGGLEGGAEGVVFTEDQDGRWANAYGVSGRPACVLVGPRGDVVWRQESGITAEELASALDKYATGGGEIAVVPIRLSIRLGERPPDVPLRLGGGSELSLGRLNGLPVALAFWTRLSEPSLDQLEYLRYVHATRRESAPLIIAIGDGESPEQAAEIAKERNLPYLVLADPDRLVSRAFGVWCWPATVWIRADQRVEAVDFGVATSYADASASSR